MRFFRRKRGESTEERLLREAGTPRAATSRAFPFTPRPRPPWRPYLDAVLARPIKEPEKKP